MVADRKVVDIHRFLSAAFDVVAKNPVHIAEAVEVEGLSFAVDVLSRLGEKLAARSVASRQRRKAFVRLCRIPCASSTNRS
jgi:hypothetical protein